MDPARAGSHPTLGATVPKIVDALVNVTRQFVRLRASVLNGIARVVAAAPARFAAARVATAGGEYSLRMVIVQVSVLLFTVTFYANLAHNLTRSP